MKYKKLKKQDILNILEEKKESFKNQYGISQIGIFGSYALENETAESDVDILVEFNEGYETFDNYMDLKIFLEDKFNKKIDLVIKRSVKEILKERIYSETIYA